MYVERATIVSVSISVVYDIRSAAAPPIKIHASIDT